MDMKSLVCEYSKWFDKVDGLEDMKHIPLYDLLQMAFSAGVEAAERASEVLWCGKCRNWTKSHAQTCALCGTKRGI